MDTGKWSPPGWAESASAIAFHLDPGSGAPVYRQLVQQVERALLLGYLREGDQLPRIKDVTAGLAVNPDTVQKAYRELETRGIAEGRRGLGTFVVAAPDLPDVREIARLRRRLVDWLDDCEVVGLTGEMTAALFSAALRDVELGANRRPVGESEREANTSGGTA